MLNLKVMWLKQQEIERGKKSSSVGCCVEICTRFSEISPLAMLINSLQVSRLCSLQS